MQSLEIRTKRPYNVIVFDHYLQPAQPLVLSVAIVRLVTSWSVVTEASCTHARIING